MSTYKELMLPLRTVHNPKKDESKNVKDEQIPDTKAFIDREQIYVAALLTRFKALVVLAAQPPGDGATKELAASHALQMEVETNALVSCQLA